MSNFHYTGLHGHGGDTYFDKSLEIAENPRAALLFDGAYRDVLPTCEIDRPLSRHTEEQAAGRDVTLITLKRQLRVEEKYRPDRSHKDLLVEYEHVYHDGRVGPGWAERYNDPRDGGPHVIAYGFRPTSTVVLVPWAGLREIWHRFGPDWIETASRNYALFRRGGIVLVPSHKNRDYVSWSIAVPLSVIQQNVRHVRVIEIPGGAK